MQSKKDKYPIIKPEDCPGELMKWISKRDEENFQKWMNMLRAELTPVARFMKIASENRIWLVGLTTAVAVITLILWIHIKMIT
jgi:hypothetical protein